MKSEHKFTKDELYEIEKVFDYQASGIQEQMARVLNSIAIVSKAKAKMYANKVFASHVKSYDMYRTISVKCEMMRK